MSCSACSKKRNLAIAAKKIKEQREENLKQLQVQEYKFKK
jgi:hypothetical protein